MTGRQKEFGDTLVVNVREDVMNAVTELMTTYGMKKSDAVRSILDNGLVYMSIYGDGFGNET